MAKITYSVTEARDHILKRIGSEGSSEYETIVLDLLNRAMSFVAAQHDWSGLIKTSTFTTTDATGVVTLAYDVDRILTMHQDGSDFMLAQIGPLEFEQFRESDYITEPKFWCYYGSSRDTEAESPDMQIEIFAAPASGTTYRIRYIKHLDEMTAGGTVPYLPPHLWELVQQKALLDALKYTDTNANAIKLESDAFYSMLQRYVARETFGSSKIPVIRQSAAVSNYYAGRKK